MKHYLPFSKFHFSFSSKNTNSPSKNRWQIINRKWKINNKGFTLIELLFYMGILAILIGVLGNLFGTVVDTQLESSANTSVDRDKEYIFARLAYDLHRADSITTPAAIGTTNTSLALSIGGITHTYSVNGSGALVDVNTTGTYALNTYDTKISNLSFTRLGNTGGTKDTIKVSFTLTSVFTERKGSETRTFQTTLGLR